MRAFIIATITVSTMFAGVATAQTYEQQQQQYRDRQAAYQDQQAQYQDQKDQYRHEMRQWARGAVMPREYLSDRFYVTDWQARHLREPEEGYRWVRDEDGNYVLASMASGVIADVVLIDRHH